MASSSALFGFASRPHSSMSALNLGHTQNAASSIIDGGNSAPGNPGAGTSESGVFGKHNCISSIVFLMRIRYIVFLIGADALSLAKPTPTSFTRSRIWNFTVPEAVYHYENEDTLIQAGKLFESGWFVFPWQNFFTYAFKPSDVVAMNQESSKWRVSTMSFEIDNIQPTMEFVTQTSSSFQFPNIYFEMYEDTRYQLPMYNRSFFDYACGAQGNRSLGHASTHMKEWSFYVPPEVCQFTADGGVTRAFSPLDLRLYNGEGIQFVRQIDKVSRSWSNGDGHWRHVASPWDMSYVFSDIARVSAERGHWHGPLQKSRCTFPVEQPMYGGNPGSTDFNLANSAWSGGRPNAYSATDTFIPKYIDVRTNNMQDWMSGVPFYEKPPHGILMRAVDPTNQTTTTWSFKAKFTCTMELIDNQFRYWPVGRTGLGIAGTTSYEWATPPNSLLYPQPFGTTYGDEALPGAYPFWGRRGNMQVNLPCPEWPENPAQLYGDTRMRQRAMVHRDLQDVVFEETGSQLLDRVMAASPESSRSSSLSVGARSYASTSGRGTDEEDAPPKKRQHLRFNIPSPE